MRFHLATPPGEGGVSIFELFGEDVDTALDRVFRPALPGRPLPSCGGARLGCLVDAANDEEIDEVLLGREPAEGTWSRLECWTLSIHGGTWLGSRVARLLEAVGGAPATRREVLEMAIEAGALDGIRACAFERLVEATTERAAEFFLRQYEGELSGVIADLVSMARSGHVGRARQRARELLEASRRALRLGDPLRLLLAGRPNAGKSTLFNRLVERERVLVSPRAGTTRDFLRERIAIDGFPIEIIDSAGLRAAASDPVEEEAIRRVRHEAVDAVIYLVAPPWRMEDPDSAFLERFDPASVLCVANFLDEPGGDGLTHELDAEISALRGDGVDELRRLVLERAIGQISSTDSGTTTDPVAPFTPAQIGIVEAIGKVLDQAGQEISTATLDEVERLSIIGLQPSW